MSTSRAIGSLFGVGSRLIVDQFIPKSAGRAGTAPKKLFGAASTASSASPASRQQPWPISKPICWSCRHSYTTHTSRRQQIRLSSSTPKPPNPNTDEKKNTEEKYTEEKSNYEFDIPPPLSPPPPPFPHPTATNAADATTNYSKEAPKISSNREQEKDGSPSSSSSSSQPPPPRPDLDLPSAQNERRSALNQSLSAFMDRAQTTLFSASQRINDLTGYSSIETLKSQIETLESQLRAAQAHLTAARSAYKTAVSDRSATQREVTTLLARQKTWTPLDFERFTTLYRQDYELEASVAERATELEQAERDAERLGRELGGGILARYHEEQIWSDKIRRMSTWGTWGLMGVNILLFLVLQFGAEPWRRQRLVRGFEEKVREALAAERALREEFERATAAAAAATAAAAAAAIPMEEEEVKEAVVEAEETPIVAIPESEVTPPPTPGPAYSEYYNYIKVSWREALMHPDYWRLDYWRLVFDDLMSDRRVALRMRDLSLVAIEGAVTGAFFAWTVLVLFFRRA